MHIWLAGWLMERRDPNASLDLWPIELRIGTLATSSWWTFTSILFFVVFELKLVWLQWNKSFLTFYITVFYKPPGVFYLILSLLPPPRRLCDTRRRLSVTGWFVSRIVGGFGWKCQGSLDLYQLGGDDYFGGDPDQHQDPGYDWKILYHCGIAQTSAEM